MKVYVATRFGSYERAREVGFMLKQAGHEPTANWIDVAEELGGECGRVKVGDPFRKDNADLDLKDIRRSDALIILVEKEGGTGMWIEMGYAMGIGAMGGGWPKRVLGVGPCLDRSLFFEVCEVFELAEQAVAALDHPWPVRRSDASARS